MKTQIFRHRLPARLKATLIDQCYNLKIRGVKNYHKPLTMQGCSIKNINEWLGEYVDWKANKNIKRLKKTSTCVEHWKLLQKEDKWISILWNRVKIRISK